MTDQPAQNHLVYVLSIVYCLCELFAGGIRCHTIMLTETL